MKSIRIKAFITHKKSLSFDECADRFAINIANGRFAIADGVSHSYMPNIWSEIVCKSYVTETLSYSNSWINDYAKDKLRQDTLVWKKRVEEIEKKADEDTAFLYSISKDAYGRGATTLAGIHIDRKIINVDVLGDSTIFQIGDNSKFVNTFANIVASEGYNNHPNYIDSNGFIKGVPTSLSVPLLRGYVMLMTDALADWFEHQLEIDSNLPDTLWNLNDHYDYESFVNYYRSNNKNHLKDDDCTMVILKIEDVDYDGFIIEYIDDFKHKKETGSKRYYETKDRVELLDQYEEDIANFEKTKKIAGSKQQEKYSLIPFWKYINNVILWLRLLFRHNCR